MTPHCHTLSGVMYEIFPNWVFYSTELVSPHPDDRPDTRRETTSEMMTEAYFRLLTGEVWTHDMITHTGMYLHAVLILFNFTSELPTPNPAHDVPVSENPEHTYFKAGM